MQRLTVFRIFPVAFASVMLCALTGCDGGTNISGSVRDGAGRPITGATVTMQISDRVEKCITQADGRYAVGMTHAPFPNVDILIHAEKQGYKRFEQHLKSTSELNRHLDIVLGNFTDQASK